VIHVGAVKLGWAEVRQINHDESRKHDERGKIPFAPSVAAALISVFMLGCLAPRIEILQTSGLQAIYLCSTRVGDMPWQKAASAAISLPIAR
jgi:hypothetical protein